MARRPDVSQYKTFEDVASRLDEIVDAVRAKDLSLERSLDLFDEAIALGSKAVDLVDTTEFSPSELERMAEVEAEAEHETAPGAEAEVETEANAEPAPEAAEDGEADAGDTPSEGIAEAHA